MLETQTVDTIKDTELFIIDQEKKSAYNYRERRHDDWKDNYILSRDKVITNRLTQRQTINIPLMKYGLATVLKDIDEPATTYFSSLSNDEGKEILYNEAWNEYQRLCKSRTRDRAFKKNLCLYGRAYRKLNIVNGKFVYEIILAENMLIDRYVDPLDIDSARILIQINIFRTLTDIVNNDDYDKQAREDLKRYFSEESRVVESESNTNKFQNNSNKMREMGVTDVSDPVVGTTYVELNEVYRKEFDETEGREVAMKYVVATTDGGMYKLSKKPLHDVLGETEEDAWYDHFPYTSAGADLESDDWYCDAPADAMRQPNKVLNSFVSSMVENRILRNYNMHYYDSSDASFVPQVFQPTPWGWFPIPGNPNEKVKDVIVGDLSDSLDEMQFIISIAEKAVGATSVQTGELPPSQVKLGQTELALSNAKERTKGMLVPIQQEYEDFAQKYVWMIEGASSSLNELKISRRGRETKRMYTTIVKPTDYVDSAGWDIEVKMKEDKDAESMAVLQKLQVAKAEMPMNTALGEIYKKRLLDFAGLKSAETQAVMDWEKNNPMQLQIDPATGQPMQPQMAQQGGVSMQQAV